MMENLRVLQSKRLVFIGVLLFTLGLFVGLFIPLMANPRMGLSTHLEGIMNGIFITVLGLIWNRIELSGKWLSVSFWLIIYGTFTNFIAVLLAAITGAGKMMPIANGQEKGPVLEAIISFLLVSLALVMLAACVLILIGLYRHLKQKRERVIVSLFIC
jgi:hydroxylaminobenzene mutase